MVVLNMAKGFSSGMVSSKSVTSSTTSAGSNVLSVKLFFDVKKRLNLFKPCCLVCKKVNLRPLMKLQWDLRYVPF